MPRYAFAAGMSALMAWHALRSKSLTRGGSVAAFLLGLTTFSSTYFVFTTVLLAFFLSGSKLTKYKSERKRKLEQDFDKGAQRTVTQVLCNGLTGGVCAFAFQYFYERADQCLDHSLWGTVLLWSYIGHYACCAGDTWASEVGVLSKTAPIHIITFRQVPPGTNGGISPLGTIASLAGGIFIGMVATMSMALDQRCSGIPFHLILIGLLGGLFGSLIDSVLGATVQQTLYSTEKKIIVSEKAKDVQVISGWNILDNHQVNFISSLMTAALCGAAAYHFHSTTAV